MAAVVASDTSKSNVSATPSKVAKKEDGKQPKFVGLDIGTSFVVSARMKDDDNVAFSSIRSAFLAIASNPRNKKMLQTLKHSYIETDGEIYLVGDPAVDLANAFSQEVRRPMKAGVLSPKEREAIKVTRILIKEVLGPAQGPCIVAYSSPADPVDGSFSVAYHEGLMKDILEKDLGYKAIAMNEAHALAFSELADDSFTGLCFSFGAGMVNAVMTYAGIDVLKFSIPNGGDWIDTNAGKAMGKTASQMQIIKEEGVNLLAPEGEDQRAISIYYVHLIRKAVEAFNTMYQQLEDKPQLRAPIPVIIAGGTSMAQGFIDLFKKAITEHGFPIQYKEIRHANDPLKSVAEGLLLAAMDTEDSPSA